MRKSVMERAESWDMKHPIPGPSSTLREHRRRLRVMRALALIAEIEDYDKPEQLELSRKIAQIAGDTLRKTYE